MFIRKCLFHLICLILNKHIASKLALLNECPKGEQVAEGGHCASVNLNTQFRILHCNRFLATYETTPKVISFILFVVLCFTENSVTNTLFAFNY